MAIKTCDGGWNVVDVAVLIKMAVVVLQRNVAQFVQSRTTRSLLELMPHTTSHDTLDLDETISAKDTVHPIGYYHGSNPPMELMLLWASLLDVVELY